MDPRDNISIAFLSVHSSITATKEKKEQKILRIRTVCLPSYAFLCTANLI